MLKPSALVPAQRNRVLLWMSALLTAIAVIDALGAGTWDLVLVLGIALALQSFILLTIRGPRPAVPLRGDLFRWLEQRSAATGESFELIADRCVAAYRAGLSREQSEVRDER